MSKPYFEEEALEYVPEVEEWAGETSGAQKNWYYIDAYRIDSGTPQLVPGTALRFEATAAEAARAYDGMCGRFSASSPASVLTRCYVWFDTSRRWVPCRSSVGFPGTFFCGRLDRS